MYFNILFQLMWNKHKQKSSLQNEMLRSFISPKITLLSQLGFFKSPLKETMMWPESSQVRELTNAPIAGEVCNHGHRDGGHINFHEKTRKEHYFNSHSQQTNLSSKLVYRTPFPKSTFLHD